MRATHGVKLKKHNDDDIPHAGQRGTYRICEQIHLFWHPTNDNERAVFIYKLILALLFANKHLQMMCSR